MGGSNDASNLVILFPEEHYVAHQLLVKIYPHNHKLVNAAVMMCVDNKKYPARPKNKLYGWLRKKLSIANRISQTGARNSQHGTMWVYNLASRISKKIKVADYEFYQQQGWAKGRIQDFTMLHNCKICGSLILHGKKVTCSEGCKKILHSQIRSKDRPLYNRETEFLELYSQYSNTDKVLKIMGFPGNQAHWGKQARELLQQNSATQSVG